jgi:dienelactone hydrolase
MATIALFHPVLGIRPGVLDLADRLRTAGHEVHIMDLFEGRTFDTYEPAMEFAHGELGFTELLRRASEAVEDLPDGFVPIGFSLGCVFAVYTGTKRHAPAIVMIGGAIPPSAFEGAVVWPAGLAAQTHSTVGDPWRDQAEVDAAIAEIATAGGTLEVFDYPGSGHLFNDPTLPSEYDPDSTELLYERVLAFLATHGASG